jgi:CRP-like cAMP-binding protein
MDRFLRQLDFFKTIPPDRLVPLFSKRISKGEPVFNEGDPPEAVFILKSGLVQTIKYTSHDEPSTFDFIMPGQMLGMIAVMDNKNYPVTATALRDSEVIRLSATVFQEFLQSSADFRKEVFRQVGNHLRNSQTLLTSKRASSNSFLGFSHLLSDFHFLLSKRGENFLPADSVLFVASLFEAITFSSILQL